MVAAQFGQYIAISSQIRFFREIYTFIDAPGSIAAVQTT
jgi:hypothetical protein